MVSTIIICFYICCDLVCFVILFCFFHLFCLRPESCVPNIANVSGFKWQSTVLSTILPLFMCIEKKNTCTMYINCCTCSQPKYAWHISCWTLSKQSEKIHADGPACVWFKKSNPIFTLFVQSKMNGVRVLVLNATFSNISVIPWWSVLLVDETWGPGENHRPVTRQWQAERINRHRNNDWHKGRRDKCSVQ